VFTVMTIQILCGDEAWPTGLWLGFLFLYASRYFLRYMTQFDQWQDEDDD
jgi:hypothetical protein